MSTKRGWAAVLEGLRTRWWVVLLCAVIAGASAYASRELRDEKYEASAAVLFRSTNLDASVLNGASYFGRSNDPLREAATNFELVQSPAVASRVSTVLGGRPSANEILDLMSFREIGSSDVVEVSATDTSAPFAARLANTWADEFVAYRRESDRSQVAEAISLIRGELDGSDPASTDARLQELRQTLERLRVIQALQTGGAEVVDRATAPEDPVGPPLLLVVIGATLLGALLGTATATLAQHRDRRLKSGEAAGEALGLPVLASIPRLRPAGGPSSSSGVTTPAAREAFRTLALRLRFFDLDRARRVVAVISAESGEGKTSIAVALASTYAAMGRRVIVVDCDLRQGDLRLRLPIGSGPGLVEVLSDQASLADAIQKVSLAAEPGVDKGAPSAVLHVLAAGASPPNPIQMLSSNAMRDVLTSLRENFDHVLLDTAPLLRISDTEALLGAVDGLVVVARIQQTTLDDLRGVAQMLEGDSTRALGVVINDVGRREARHGYYGTIESQSPAQERLPL